MVKQGNLISERLRKVFVRRKYRDALFQRVFREKEDLLDLYNAINGTNYSDPNSLEITTLEDAIYMSMKNDTSFIVSSTLNLYEHQSTVNPNMPIRGFMYFAKLYQGYISRNKLDIYGQKKIMLPTPHFIVFYNGSEKMPDEKVIKLSDSFIKGKNDKNFPELECRATILNINYGHNEATLKSCKRLSDYSYFIYKVDENIRNGCTKKDAINAAIDYCIEHDILSDILTKARSEVMHSLLTYYDEKLHLKTVWNEGFEAGTEEVDMLKATIREICAEKEQALSEITEKDAVITEKDAEIERLKKELQQYKN